MNLIICCTPFQAKLAKEIVKLKPEESFIQVMMSPVDNEKYRYYYSLLANSCNESLFLCRSQKLFSWLISYLKIRFFLRKKNIKSIYISNINDELIHMVVDSLKEVSIYTFDDGTANILKTSSFYYREIKNKSIILRRLLNIKTTMREIKRKSKLHYTIYSDISNIIDNTFFIDIFNEKRGIYKNIEGNDNVIKIFIGQPFYSLSHKNIDLVSKLVKDLSIDFYIPHPREDYHIKDVEYINSKLIFEDLFLNRFLGKPCVIYTFFSGAILSLIKLESVRLVSIQPVDMYDSIIEESTLFECYRLFKSLGVEIMETY